MSKHWYTRKPKLIIPVIDTPPPAAAPPFPRVLPPRTPPAAPIDTPERSVLSAALETCPLCGVGWRHGALEACWNCQPPAA